jgi:Electron transfer DM13
MLVSTLRTLAVAAISLASVVVGQDATAQKIGWSGTLMKTDGGLAGIVTVVDAATLMITNYKLVDASAPALYWWGAVDGNLKGGFRISNEQITQASTSDKLTIKLDAGKSTTDFVTVGLWCEKFQANFGQATLMAANGNSTSAPSPSQTTSIAPTQSTKAGAGTSNSISFGAVGTLAMAAILATWMA